MKRSIFVLCSIVFSLAACTKNQTHSLENIKNYSGVIGGEPAAENALETASTVAFVLHYPKKPIVFCTGTLISKNLVLTATHCFKAVDPVMASAYFGNVLPARNDDPHLVKVKAVLTHPDYDIGVSPTTGMTTAFNDVALVLLETEAPAFAKPVPLLNDIELPKRQSILVAGYGIVQDDPSTIDAKGLNSTHVELAKVYDDVLVVDQTKRQGVCFGDSGGPGYLETSQGLIVIGITRGAHGNIGHCHGYAELTYASRYKSYLLEKAAELGGEPPVFVDAPSEL